MPIDCDKRSLHARGARLLATQIRYNALGEFLREAKVQVLADTSTHRYSESCDERECPDPSTRAEKLWLSKYLLQHA